LIEITGTSQEGVSVVVCQFDVTINVVTALNDVRAKVDSVVGRLPKDVTKPVIDKFDTSASPILTLGVSSPTLNSQQLRDLIDQKVKDRLAQVAGVGAVSVNGGDTREFQVQVRKDQLLAYGIGILDVQRAVQAATLNIPSGRVIQGERETSVRVLGEFKTISDIQNMIVSISDARNQGAKSVSVRLSDIADVKETVAERRSYSRLNGNDAITLFIQKSRDGNAIEIERQFKALLPQLEKDFPVKFVVTFDSAKRIDESLFDLLLTLYIGILLVAGIVYVFLHNLRGTVIVAIAIPVCLLATLMLMQVFGFTVNNLSMLALSLAIGVLVDDAIVVLENIYRHLEHGEDPVEAAINGRSEIGLAAIAITMADVVVFVPVGLMGGIVGQFFRPLGLGFALCVFLSLFVSFTITPMLAARWYRAGEDMEHPKGGFARWFENAFSRFAGRYRRVLAWALNHRWFVFISGWVILISVFMGIGGGFAPNIQAAIGTGAPLMMPCIAIGVVVFIVNIFRGYVKPKFILYGLLFGLAFPTASVVGHVYGQWKKSPLFAFQFFPVSDQGTVSIVVQMPPGTALQTTAGVVERIEKIVLKHPETKYVISRVGSKGGGFSAGDVGTNFAAIDVTLRDKAALLDRLLGKVKRDNLRLVSDTSVSAEMLAQIGRVAGAQVTVATGGAQGFGSAIQMSFRSDNQQALQASAQRVREKLAEGAVPGLINVDISSKPGKPELQAIPDRARMADSGMTTADIASAMRTLYEGNTDTKLRVDGREYNIRVMMDLEDRNNPDIVGQMPLKFSQGRAIYLDSVADLRQAVGVDKIDRRSREQEIRITADLLPGYAAGNAQQQVDQYIKDNNLLDPIVTQKNLGQADVQQREMGYLMGALLTGLVLVFMLLASLYNNLVYPFVIQLAQPQALTGALLALVLTDKSLNIVGFIGLIALVGLVGKNAILLVDYTNTLRERGKDRLEAILEAGPTRLRPIMMTTIAVILGMLPVALAIGRGSEFRETIGIIIIGGIVLSTVLTLVVIPCSYTIFDDLLISFTRTKARRTHRDSNDNVAAPMD
jgi:HAE1 family hydrophobic/amphiphilic exporter-1